MSQFRSFEFFFKNTLFDARRQARRHRAAVLRGPSCPPPCGARLLSPSYSHLLVFPLPSLVRLHAGFPLHRSFRRRAVLLAHSTVSYFRSHLFLVCSMRIHSFCIQACFIVCFSFFQFLELKAWSTYLRPSSCPRKCGSRAHAPPRGRPAGVTGAALACVPFRMVCNFPFGFLHNLQMI